jgi:uncharacterized Zn finger protein
MATTRTFPAVKVTSRLSKIGGVEMLSIRDAKGTVAVYGVRRDPRSVRLYKIDGETYDVAKFGEEPRCTCPDYATRDRPGGCRHVVACRQEGLIR